MIEMNCKNGNRLPSYTNKHVIGDERKRLAHLVAPHVESFNYFINHGLLESIQNIPAMDIKLEEDLYINIKFVSASIGYPTKRDEFCSDDRLTPREARERNISYTGSLNAVVIVKISGKDEKDNCTELELNIKLGDLPIMVQSSRCHLKDLSPSKLVDLKEEANEMGGYFIMNGIERVIRLLQVQRRNYAMAIERSSYKNRGTSYSDKGVAMRCVRQDQSSVTVTLHYLNNGGATLKFVLRKQEFLLPVVIVAKALVDISDKELFDRIVQKDHANTFLTARLEILLRDAKQYNVFTQVYSSSSSFVLLVLLVLLSLSSL